MKGFLIMRTDKVIVCLPSRETPTGVLMSPYGRFVLALNKQFYQNCLVKVNGTSMARVPFSK